MSAALQIPGRMRVEEFLEWCPADGRRWQLFDGEPRAMAPAKVAHGKLQAEVARVLGNHLLERGSPCEVVTAPGIVPRIQAAHNFRIPDLAVTCTPTGPDDAWLAEPVLAVEILSPSNQSDTRANVWAFTSIPSIREILVLHSLAIRAEVFRRGPDGHWPPAPEVVETGDLVLESLGFRAPVRALYRTVRGG